MFIHNSKRNFQKENKRNEKKKKGKRRKSACMLLIMNVFFAVKKVRKENELESC